MSRMSKVALRRAVGPAVASLAIAMAICFAPSVMAQEKAFPDRPIRLVVGFPPGGGVDAVARLFADKLSNIFQKPVIVINHPGASGGIAGKQISTEPPDGYTVLVNSNSMLIYSLMNPKAELDILRDLVPIASVAPQAMIIVGSPELKADTLKQAFELSRKQALNYGSPGTGSIPHLVVERLRVELSKTRLEHVPFQGAPPALTATMANHVDLASVTLPPAAPFVASGKLKGLAVTTSQRSAALPNVPTLAELGWPEATATAWTGFFVPPKTPELVIKRLEQAILEVAAMPDVKEKLVQLGFEATSTPGAQFKNEVSSEAQAWRAVLERAKLINN